MDDFAKMDIFFMVSTAAVVIIAALITLALIRIVRILHQVERISRVVSDETTRISNDIDALRTTIKTEGFKLKHLGTFLRRQAARFTGTRT